MNGNVKHINLVQGEITLRGNGKKFHAQIHSAQKFSPELERALKREKDPAQALLFLAELGAKLDPRNSGPMKYSDRKKWVEFFGEGGSV